MTKKLLVIVITSLILGVIITLIFSLTTSKTDECNYVYYGYPLWVKYEEPKLAPIKILPDGEKIGLGCAIDFSGNAEEMGWILDTIYWGLIIFIILLAMNYRLKLITKYFPKKNKELKKEN